MHQLLQYGECEVFGRIDQCAAFIVPAPAMNTSAFSAVGVIRVLRGKDAPGGDGIHSARLLLRNDAVLDAAYQVDHFARAHFDTRVIQWRFAA